MGLLERSQRSARLGLLVLPHLNVVFVSVERLDSRDIPLLTRVVSVVEAVENPVVSVGCVHRTEVDVRGMEYEFVVEPDFPRRGGRTHPGDIRTHARPLSERPARRSIEVRPNAQNVVVAVDGPHDLDRTGVRRRAGPGGAEDYGRVKRSPCCLSVFPMKRSASYGSVNSACFHGMVVKSPSHEFTVADAKFDE